VVAAEVAGVLTVAGCTAGFPLGLIEGMSLRENMASVRFWIPVLFVCKTVEVINYDRSSWLLCLKAVRNKLNMQIDGCKEARTIGLRVITSLQPARIGTARTYCIWTIFLLLLF